TSPCETIGAGESVAAAARRLRTTNAGILPVLDRGTLAGVVTDHDVVVRAVAEGRDPDATAVREVMTENVAICEADDAVATAAAIMARKEVRRLVVLDREGHLVGVVSMDDLATAGAGERAPAPVRVEEPPHPLIN
ncbi:MAG: CBS domain-containing protein, partial [Polyangia bacterium]